jgi:hypothetical protein
MAKPPGRCIFCGNGGTTKQHIWPGWLKSVVPRTFANHKQVRGRTGFTSGDEPLVAESRVAHRQGDPGTRRLRMVCRGCNNGWMSRLENRAKPVLAPVIRGETFDLHPTAQAVVPAWAAMMVMVAEHDDPATVAVPAPDRRFLMDAGSPPDHWRVWIGRYKGRRWKTGFCHHAFDFPWTEFIHSSSVEPVVFSSRTTHNLQVTTFAAGEMLLHTFSCIDPGRMINHAVYGNYVGMAPIFPVNGGPIHWHDLPIHGDADVDRVRDALKEVFVRAREAGLAARSPAAGHRAREGMNGRVRSWVA